MKVLIVCDWPIFRAGISQILYDEFGAMEVTETSSTLNGFDLRLGPWDIAFVGVDAPHHKGRDFITALRRVHPRQPVLALYSQAGIDEVERTVNGFVQGLIPRQASREEVVAAVLHLFGGPGEHSPKNFGACPQNPGLSRRELEVLRLIAAGKNVKETAAALNVSTSTVSTHRVRMLRKLRLGSTGELMRYAFRNHLAD